MPNEELPKIAVITSQKIGGYIFVLIPWFVIFLVLMSYLHSQVFFEYDRSLIYPDPRYLRLSEVYGDAIWSSLAVWFLSVFCFLFLLIDVIVQKKILRYKNELMIMTTGHFVCIYVFTTSGLMWFLD